MDKKKRGPVSYSTYQEAKDRIAELEAVAEAGEVSCLCPNEGWADDAHRKALRAAGYLQDQGATTR